MDFEYPPDGLALQSLQDLLKHCQHLRHLDIGIQQGVWIDGIDHENRITNITTLSLFVPWT